MILFLYIWQQERRVLLKRALERGFAAGVVVAVGVCPVALWEYLLLEGVEAHTRVLVLLLPPQTREAQDAFEGDAHVLVPVGVDDGVHEGVALGQHQEELLEGQDVTGFTQTIQQEQHQPRRPTHHETTCGEHGRAQRQKHTDDRKKKVTQDVFQCCELRLDELLLFL